MRQLYSFTNKRKTKNKSMKVIEMLLLPTTNRGNQTFLISKNNKNGYFAHELGKLTQFAQVFNREDRIAHIINKQIRYGNQYKRFLKSKPFTSIEEAKMAIQEHANTTIIYS